MVTLPELLCIWVFSTCAAEKTERKNQYRSADHCWPNIKNLQKYNQWMTAATKPTCCDLKNNFVFKMLPLFGWWTCGWSPTQTVMFTLHKIGFTCKILWASGSPSTKREGREENCSRQDSRIKILYNANAMTIEYKSRDVYSTHDWIHDRNELVVQHPDYYQSKSYQPMLGCASWKIVNHNESLICSNEYKFIWNTIYFKHLQDLATVLQVSSIMTTLTTCSSNICPCQSDSDDSNEPPPSDWRVRSQWQQRFLLPIAASIIPKV